MRPLSWFLRHITVKDVEQAEDKRAQFKPRSFFLQFQGVLTQSRGVGHPKEVTPLTTLQEIVENMLDKCLASLVYPTRQ